MNQDATEEYELLYTSPQGGQVWAHHLHGKEELPANENIARILAYFGEVVWLLSTSGEPDAKNPDASIDGAVWEFKTNSTGTGTSIDTEIKRAAKQANNVLLHLTVPMRIQDLENAIFGRVRQCAKLLKLRIIYQRQLYEFTRADIMSQAFRGRMKGEGSPT